MALKVARGINPETALQRNIRLSINRSMRARLVRNNVGVDPDKGVRFGLGVGSADLVGLLPNGRAIALEVKTPKGRIRPEQETWLAVFRRWGGFAAIVRTEAEAFEALTRAEAGFSE